MHRCRAALPVCAPQRRNVREMEKLHFSATAAAAAVAVAAAAAAAATNTGINTRTNRTLPHCWHRPRYWSLRHGGCSCRRLRWSVDPGVLHRMSSMWLHNWGAHCCSYSQYNDFNPYLGAHTSIRCGFRCRRRRCWHGRRECWWRWHCQPNYSANCSTQHWCDGGWSLRCRCGRCWNCRRDCRRRWYGQLNNWGINCSATCCTDVRRFVRLCHGVPHGGETPKRSPFIRCPV